MRGDEGGVGGCVAAGHLVEHAERAGEEAALEVGVQQGVRRGEGLRGVESAGLEEGRVGRGGELRVAPSRGPAEGDGRGGSGGAAARRKQWRRRGRE